MDLESASELRTELSLQGEHGVVEGIKDDLPPLGFTLYRTDYCFPDEIWEMFVERLEIDSREDFERKFGGEQQQDQKEIDAVEQLRPLLQIDARSDSALVNDRTLDEIRSFFRDSAGGRPINADSSM
ncbi:hypothetical protein NLG97_g5045 [Lecanicillium saksenae]|uniref:Uncharacterized protein n=1 Tax=Lecanicillium saksenae TaxID=468837 RepID=A0ACC1QU40_9HYPO|nr:hypothetical protein NLG97_g5045 [Lecanicillium saksenae]